MYNKAREGALFSNQTCSCCGSSIELYSFNLRLPLPQKMKAENLCYSCAFWRDKIENPLPGRQIINGTHYVFHEWEKSQSYFQCYGGSMMYLLTNDRIPKQANSAWCQGNIPIHFRDQLPNTAVFISRSIYRKICGKPDFKCQAKGCWDRYNCFWFDKSLYKNREWNSIPSSHKVGGENCESFINKKEIYG